MGYGLYIHIPFCVQKCPYCGFYSVADDSMAAPYLQALLQELRSFNYPEINSIYIGGGTPSSLGLRLPHFIEAMLPLIRYTGREFTVEVNPESVSVDLCRALAGLPVSRISMGVQSLFDGVLRLLGRAHNADRAKQAYDLFRSFLHVDVNLDLIYDIPQVPMEMMYTSLTELIRMGPEHISAYSYSPDTGYLTDKPSPDPDQMEVVYKTLGEASYRRYEVSNYAREGKISRHNTGYWQMNPYIGLGASAHSMIYEDGGHLRWQHQNIEQYLADPLHREGIEKLSRGESLKEAVVFGLRQTQGVDLDELTTRYQCSFPDDFFIKIKTLVDEGLLRYEGMRLYPSEKGILLLNSVMEYLW